ncbi:MAG: flippase-like domain-containing protein [Elusimicrobia bacterium]|nr:flippase-like domain-containing protein [Elusimicrobiota bacterium]
MKGWRWGVAMAVSAAGIWLALRGVDGNAVRASLERVRHPWFLLFIPLAGGLEYAIRTERWRLVLGEPRALRPALFPIVAGAFFLNNVLPFRAGEAARVYWTHRRTGRPLVGAVAALAVDRLMDSLALVSLFLAALAAGRTAVPRGAAWGLLAVGILGFLFFVLLARRSERVGRWLDSSRLPGPVQKFLRAFMAGAAPLGSFRTLALILVLSLAIWSLNAAVFMGAGRLFGIHLGWTDGSFLLAGIALGVALPSAPGFVGTYEAAGVGTLALLGHEKAVAFPFIAALHLAQMAGTALWGLPSLVAVARTGKKITALEDL